MGVRFSERGCTLNETNPIPPGRQLNSVKSSAARRSTRRRGRRTTLRWPLTRSVHSFSPARSVFFPGLSLAPPLPHAVVQHTLSGRPEAAWDGAPAAAAAVGLGAGGGIGPTSAEDAGGREVEEGGQLSLAPLHKEDALLAVEVLCFN